MFDMNCINVLKIFIEETTNDWNSDDTIEIIYFIFSWWKSSEMVILLLESFPDSKEFNHLAEINPFEFAIIVGRLEIVKYLIEKKSIDLSKPVNYKNHTALSIASHYRHLEIVKFLVLEKKVDLNQTTSTGDTTPLWVASWRGSLEIVKFLVENGADLEKSAALSVAIASNHLEISKFLISKGCNVDRESRDSTPLIEACSRGNFEIAKLLIENKAQVNKCDPNRQSAFYHCCRGGFLELGKYLISVGCEYSTTDLFGRSPLWIASSDGKLDIVKYLVTLEGGVDLINKVESQSEENHSPLSIAIQNERFEVAKFLVDSGANLSLVNGKGENPFFVSCKWGKLEMVKFFFDRFNSKGFFSKHFGTKENIGLNKVNLDLDTPLTIAVTGNHLMVVKFLVESGAALNKSNGFSETPLKIASKKKYSEIITYLTEKGAKMS